MTTTKKAPTEASKASKATKETPIDVQAMMAELQALKANNQALQAQNEALAAQIPTPRKGTKMGNHEPFKQGAEAARFRGANGIPVTYAHASTKGLLREVVALAWLHYGTDEFANTALKALMMQTMQSAGGGPRYGTDNAANAAAQRVRNAVWTEDETGQYVPSGYPGTVPFTLRKIGNAVMWTLDKAGVEELLDS